MDINQKLLERKNAMKKSRLNRVLKVKRKFKSSEKHIVKEFDEKLTADPLAQKKQDFYTKLFKGELDEEVDPEPRRGHRYRERIQETYDEQPQFQEQPEQLRRVHPQRQQVSAEPEKKTQTTKKQKILNKKIYKEKTKSGQPVMKNYINYIVYKLDQEKRNQK